MGRVYFKKLNVKSTTGNKLSSHVSSTDYSLRFGLFFERPGHKKWEPDA